MGSITAYLREVLQELQKVTWPTREHTIQMTVLVIVVSVGVSLYVGALDFMFQQLITVLINK